MPTLLANGIDMYYEWEGLENGPVLVMINGLLTDLSSWNHHVKVFTPNFRVLRYDCRGQGGTEKHQAGSYIPALHARDLEALLHSLGVDKASFLGVSSGGCIALQYAVRNPGRVTALVLANTYARADTALRVKLNSWAAAMQTGGGPLRFDVATPWVWGASFLERNYQALRPFREHAGGLEPHGVLALIHGAMEHDLEDQASVITCPTLLLAGDEDLLTPISYSQVLHRCIAGSQLQIFDQAGHAMFLEQAQRFASTVTDFFQASLPELSPT
jgi:3-oxoadipate enol-lactonase